MFLSQATIVKKEQIKIHGFWEVAAEAAAATTETELHLFAAA